MRTPFPDRTGALGPSEHQQDARLVLARLHEAKGDVPRAIEAYESSPSEEARRALVALTEPRLAAPSVVTLRAGQAATIPATVANVDEVQIRAYPRRVREQQSADEVNYRSLFESSDESLGLDAL